MSFILSSQWIGRFGNRMYQYAYALTYANKNKINLILPSNWEGTRLFKNNPYNVLDRHIQEKLNTIHFESPDSKLRKDIISEYFPNIQFIDPDKLSEPYTYSNSPVCFSSVCAYNTNIFSEMSKTDLLDIFEFSDEVKNSFAYQYWEKIAGTYDIAHLRRDDISDPEYNKTNIQGYSVISKQSYIRSMERYGFNPSDFQWTSDDYTKKWHKDRKNTDLFGWNYPEGSVYKKGEIFDWLEDFLRLYFARTIFRANSSFSWWAGFLSPTATVYSPVLDKQFIYGRDGIVEIDVKFVKGNNPHWMYGSNDIIIK